MKPWWQVVKPHRDIREGRLDEAVFAADLGDVLSQKGPVDYRDPETFFTRTYLTKGLANLLSGITSRLCGEKGSEAVIQVQTPFGGGKTLPTRWRENATKRASLTWVCEGDERRSLAFLDSLRNYKLPYLNWI